MTETDTKPASESHNKYERAPAKRVFAEELRKITEQRRQSDDPSEKVPVEVLLPTGEWCSRAVIAGAMTEKTKSTSPNPFYRVKVSDPTGIHYISVGSYQPEALAQLAKISADSLPRWVVVIGKPSIYKAQDKNGEDRIYVSIRAESITTVDKDIRDQWILETCSATEARAEEHKDCLIGATYEQVQTMVATAKQAVQ